TSHDRQGVVLLSLLHRRTTQLELHAAFRFLTGAARRCSIITLNVRVISRLIHTENDRNVDEPENPLHVHAFPGIAVCRFALHYQADLRRRGATNCETWDGGLPE